MRKSFKKSISLLLVILMLATLAPFAAFAEGSNEFKLSVNPYGKEEDSIDTIDWYKSDALGYYFFLPADCDTSAMTVFFNSDETVTVCGKKITSGELTDVFAGGGIFTVKCGLKLYTLTVMVSENIPAIYLETESGSLDYIHADKENKEKADIRIYENGEMQLDGSLKQIKGRGNYTWKLDKKPYNIKFDDKTSVLGMAKAKKWSLLASAVDKAIVRNPLAWYLSDAAGLYYGSEYRIADLYINGNYMGNYIICESVEVGKNRVNIFDLEGATEDVNKKDLDKYPAGGTGEGGTVESGTVCSSSKWLNIPNNPADITGGYLLECEINSRYDAEPSGFVTSRGQAMVLKAPECASQAQVEYISNYWQEAEDAICSPDGYNALGKHYSEYFDMDSLVNMYLLMEFASNFDAGISSTYFYKDTNGKLVASPVWDFDHSFADSETRMGVSYADPGIWAVSRLDYNMAGEAICNGEAPVIFNLLFRHEDFRALASARWSELSAVFGGQDTVNFVNNLANTIKSSAVMNGVRWNGIYTEAQYKNEILKVTSFIPNRKACLDNAFGSNGVQLYYDANGGSGWMFDNIIYTKGDLAHVKALTYDCASVMAPSGDYEFAGWNTAADGSGTTYLPGGVILLKGDVTLYAQWKLKLGVKPTEPVQPDDPDTPDTPDTPTTPVVNDNPAEYTFFEKTVNFIVGNPVSEFLSNAATRTVNFFTGLFKNK